MDTNARIVAWPRKDTAQRPGPWPDPAPPGRPDADGQLSAGRRRPL